jgi:hypothetical protein
MAKVQFFRHRSLGIVFDLTVPMSVPAFRVAMMFNSNDYKEWPRAHNWHYILIHHYGARLSATRDHHEANQTSNLT